MINLKIAAIAIAFASLACAGFWIYTQGQQNALIDIQQRIDRQNEKLVSNAEKWKRNYNDCVNAGKLFDFESGKCKQ